MVRLNSSQHLKDQPGHELIRKSDLRLLQGTQDRH